MIKWHHFSLQSVNNIPSYRNKINSIGWPCLIPQRNDFKALAFEIKKMSQNVLTQAQIDSIIDINKL